MRQIEIIAIRANGVEEVFIFKGAEVEVRNDGTGGLLVTKAETERGLVRATFREGTWMRHFVVELAAEV